MNQEQHAGPLNPRTGTRFVFAGGGTGGHLYPSLAVIEQLRTLNPDVQISFMCTDRPIDQKILGGYSIPAIPQTVRPFSTKPWRWPGFLLAWRGAIRRCVDLFRIQCPGVVIGAGGYGSDPPVRAALTLGIPTAILNPDLVPGRANQRLGSRVNRIYAQWMDTQAYFSGIAGFRAMGCPIRSEFETVNRADGIKRFNLDPNRQTLLVTGASQGARTINDALIALAPELVRLSGWQILHLAGQADVERVQAAYCQAGIRSTVLAYTDHMPEAMAISDFAISRAGASTLAELTAVGLPSILLPYPFHKDQHQLHNAETLNKAGAAEIVTDTRDGMQNALLLRPVLQAILTSNQKLTAMRNAARSLGRPDAARRIALDLLELSKTH